MAKKIISFSLVLLLLFSATPVTLAAEETPAVIYPAAQVTNVTAAVPDSADGRLTDTAWNEHIFYLDKSIPYGMAGNSAYVPPKGYPAMVEPVYNAYTHTADLSEEDTQTVILPKDATVTGLYLLDKGTYASLEDSPVEICFTVKYHLFTTTYVTQLLVESATLDGVDVTENYSVCKDLITRRISSGGNEIQTARIRGSLPETGSVLELQVRAEVYSGTVTNSKTVRNVNTSEILKVRIEAVDKSDLRTLLEYEHMARQEEQDFVPGKMAEHEKALTLAESVLESSSATQSEIDEAYEKLFRFAPGIGTNLTFGENAKGSLDLRTGTLSIGGTGTVDFTGSPALVGSYVQKICIEDGIRSIVRLQIPDAPVTYIELPSSLETVTPGALNGIKTLREISVDPLNRNFADLDGVLTDKAGTTILAFPNGYDKSEGYAIPREITKIGEKAFSERHYLAELHKNLMTIIVHNKVTEIGANAFSDDLMVQCAEGAYVQWYCENNPVWCKAVPVQTYSVVYDCDDGEHIYGDKVSFDYYGFTEEQDGQTIVSAGFESPVYTLRSGPERSGYTFLGWFTEKSGGEQISKSSITLTGDLKLYAHWQEGVFYNVWYSGLGSDSSQKKEENKPLILRSETPERTVSVRFRDGASTTYTKDYTLQFQAWEFMGQTYHPGDVYNENLPLYLTPVWENVAFGALPEPQKDGYKFVGWFTFSSGGEHITPDNLVAESDHADTRIVYARWVPESKQYVHFSHPDYAFRDTLTFHVGEYPTVPTAVPTGRIQVSIHPYDSSSYTKYYDKIFLGWNSQPDGSGLTFQPGDTIYTEDSWIFYPLWENPKVGKIPVPERDGYIFTGWQDSAGNPVAEDMELTTPMNIYGTWEQVDNFTVSYKGFADAQTKKAGEALTIRQPNRVKTITITYFTDAETASFEAWSYDLSFQNWISADNVIYRVGDVYTHDANLSLVPLWGVTSGDLPNPTRNGYHFLGWYDGYTTGNKVETLADIHEDTTLFARWEDAASYTVTYNANGGTNAPASQAKQPGKSLTLTTDIPKRSYTIIYNPCGGELTDKTQTFNCRFVRWNTQANGQGTKYSSGALYDRDEDITLFAMWENPRILLPEPSLDGYRFDGWFTSQTGGAKVNTGESVSASRTLYAHWTQIPTYAVSYQNNGGIGAPEMQVKTEDVSLILSENVPTRTHTLRFNPCGGSVSVNNRTYSAVFYGWNTEKNGSGKVYQAGDKYEENKDLTLYAHWILPQVGNLPTPVYVGRYFEGWFTEPTGGTEVTALTTVSTDQTLYAHWRDLSYSFDNWSPKISADIYRRTFGTSTLTDRLSAVVASIVYPNSGICYGMATTAMLMVPGGKVETASFGEDAIWDFSFRQLSDYTNGTMTLENFIKQMQVSQYSAAAQGSVKRDVDDIIRIVQDGNIIRISITKNKQGHALVGYKLKKQDNTYRLMVYDCNHAGDYSRYILLQKVNGAWRWSYDMGNGLGTWTSETGTMGYQSYADIEYQWNNMGRLVYATGGTQSHLMIVRADAFALYDEDGKCIATYEDGFQNNTLHLQEIAVEGAGQTEEADRWHLFYIPTDTVSVRNLSGGDFHAELIDINYGAVADTTADTVLFTVRDNTSGVAAMTGENTKVCRARISDSEKRSYSYEVQMFPDAKANAVSGKANSAVEFSLENGKIYQGAVERFSVRSNTYTLHYGEFTTLHVEPSELPADTAVQWEATGKAVRLEVSEDTLSCKVWSVGSGEAVITAKLTDADGTVRKRTDGEDAVTTIKMKSKGGLFWMMISLLRNLFHIVREQAK